MKQQNITIRQETEKDFEEVFNLIEKAFKNDEYSENNEQFIVETLRKSEQFIPELSIVAEKDASIVGYILLSPIKIKNKNKTVNSLALAPVAVLPKFQRQGIGGRLINYAHAKATALGFKSIIVLGHENYYPKFGYLLAESFGIKLPFKVPTENCMAIELVSNGLLDVSGTVEYPPAFYL